MMLSQFFVLSTRGDTIIRRDCKPPAQVLLLWQLEASSANRQPRCSSAKSNFGLVTHHPPS